ncbi:hypothetical protein SKAU_G00113920 [Synaphobranchus kaupii]|uniref:Uncharacterized protein n=1 Tax=Synaphobranchus kaupii TaxID=118154 RepID=A0A9Q1G0Q9_SYNKA|nr:hypothetical protein SKAU_G00113920 [Synaphobranchus kaupii]
MGEGRDGGGVVTSSQCCDLTGCVPRPKHKHAPVLLQHAEVPLVFGECISSSRLLNRSVRCGPPALNQTLTARAEDELYKRAHPGKAPRQYPEASAKAAGRSAQSERHGPRDDIIISVSRATCSLPKQSMLSAPAPNLGTEDTGLFLALSPKIPLLAFSQSAGRIGACGTVQDLSETTLQHRLPSLSPGVAAGLSPGEADFAE